MTHEDDSLSHLQRNYLRRHLLSVLILIYLIILSFRSHTFFVQLTDFLIKSFARIYSNYFPDENVTLMSTWTIYNIITLGDIKNKNNYDGNDNFNDNFYSKLTANYDINNATIV